jgi:hypothetical protein
MRFGTWNFRSLYREGVINSVVEELEKYKLDLVGVKRLGGKKREFKEQTIIHFSVEKGMLITK